VTSLRALHRYAPARALAKRLLRGRLTLTQQFHGGVICLDAVDHAWAWVHDCRYESFDRELQDHLAKLASAYDRFIDIGCNVGAMTLAVLLRNRHIDAVCIDPNKRAVALLNRSLARNSLESRATVHCALVGVENGVMPFDPTGSVTGHVTGTGRMAVSLAFGDLLNEQLRHRRCLVKLDVEGFETQLLPQLSGVEHLERCCFVIELHPKGWNELGDSELCLDVLRSTGARVTTLTGGEWSCPPGEFCQVVATWPSGSRRLITA
jgi:FkbM family methyltransferase